MLPTPSHNRLRRLATPLLALSTLTLAAQTPTTKLPAYDVATIRPNTTDSGDTTVNGTRDTLRASNWNALGMLTDAFHVRRNLVFGLPKWAQDAHYDVNAKILDADRAQLKGLTPEQRRTILRTLIESRFSLKWHYETRTMPDLQLVVAKGGSKMTEVLSKGDNWGTSSHNTDLTATAIPIANFADILSDQLEKPVVDKTGLTGHYDFHLRWTPDNAQPSADTGQAADASPPFFTALQEQLGLRLQPGKDPIQTLVIDSISPPTAN